LESPLRVKIYIALCTLGKASTKQIADLLKEDLVNVRTHLYNLQADKMVASHREGNEIIWSTIPEIIRFYGISQARKGINKQYVEIVET
jgi:DNA-binding transcriptional ArsR family regulator